MTRLRDGVEDVLFINMDDEAFDREYCSKDACRILQAMRNLKKAGRRRKNGTKAPGQIKALSAQGKSIREISAETGIPKSTVQRLKKCLIDWCTKI